MEKHKQLESVLVIVLGFLVLYLALEKPIFLWISLSIGLLSLFSSFALAKITWLWFKLAEGLGYVNSRILLSVVFFLILVPIALLARLVSGNKLKLKKNEKGEGSYFEEINVKYNKEGMEDMW
ncbi:MAG: hypothetical protein ACI8YQ_004841 [Polaribacter sp.]|jgi:hypothetical protein